MIVCDTMAGIGELLPPLEEEESVSDTHEGPGLEPELDRRKVNNPAPPLPPPPSTPSRFAKHSVYDGLASPAAARWLLTPVMAKKGRPMPDTNLVRSMPCLCISRCIVTVAFLFL